MFGRAECSGPVGAENKHSLAAWQSPPERFCECQSQIPAGKESQLLLWATTQRHLCRQSLSPSPRPTGSINPTDTFSFVYRKHDVAKVTISQLCISAHYTRWARVSSGSQEAPAMKTIEYLNYRMPHATKDITGPSSGRVLLLCTSMSFFALPFWCFATNSELPGCWGPSTQAMPPQENFSEPPMGHAASQLCPTASPAGLPRADSLNWKTCCHLYLQTMCEISLCLHKTPERAAVGDTGLCQHRRQPPSLWGRGLNAGQFDITNSD